MKKFIFTIFVAFFSSVAFAESSQEYGCRGVIDTDLINGQKTGENQRFITALEHSKDYPRYLKCEADNPNDNKFCLSGTITINNNYDVYKCEGKKWIKPQVEDCTQKAEELIESGLKYNYQQAKQNSAKYVLFYNKRSDQHLEKHCHSEIDPFKKMEDECIKNDLETGICHKLTTPNDTSNTTSKENTTNSSQSGSALSGSASASSQNIEQMTMPGTPADACEYSGGVYRTNRCFCDSNNHLEPYEPENAKDYTICTCMSGYKRQNAEMDTNGNTTWYPENDPCIPANDYEIQIVPDKIGMQRDAEDAYRNEYDNAQSWANKGTTALSTLMTGEGAMMAARAIAERKADNEAEREMAEYVSKMKCEYGGGQSVNLGDTETLPGGNELANYYAEYKQLADKLKATKAALNLRPGIEAEVLYDRAETGLYQYQTAERQSGGFTSLSRALINPDGTDAEQWNAQRAETNRDLLIGGALATVGLAGSYIANRVINKDHKKEYKELKEKFMEIKKELLIKYPEVFEPVEQEVTIEEVTSEESPITPEEIPAQTIKVTITKTAKAGAFKSGGVTLTDKGQAGITEAITNYVEEINKYTDINNIKITATGHADPQQINPKNINAITNEYKSLLNNSYLFTGERISRIDSNENLTKARAQVVVSTLIEAIIDSNQLPLEAKKATYEALGTNGDDCEETKKTEFEKCRYVDIKIEFQATPKSTQ